MLLSGALLTGAVVWVWYAWDRSVLWRTLSLEAFARDYRYSMGRADPAQPILLILCLVSAIGFAGTNRHYDDCSTSAEHPLR